MAQPTAQFEALQYGQDKIPDFGGIAMAGAKRVTELQEAERKREQEELKFRMDMIKDNPEVAYASFENSGLKNLDSYNTKVSELVKDRFNQLNEQFNTDRDKTAYVMGVSKLKGEVMNFANQVSPMIQYGQKIVELGDGASAVMYDNAESIDGMLQHGVPSMDKDGNIVNTSIIPQEDGSFKKENVGFSEMTSLTSIHERQDKFSVAANAVKSFGSDSRFIDEQGNVVLDTLLTKDGKMNPSAAKIIKANVSSLDRSSLIDIADQFGLQAQYGPGREILNKQELIDDISEREIDYAASLMQERQTEDEEAYANYSLKLKALALREAKSKNSGKPLPYDRSYYDKSSGAQYGYDSDFFEYTFKKPQSVKGLTISGYKIPVARDSETPMSDPFVVGYRNIGDGRHYAKISHTVKIPAKQKLTNGQEIETGEFIEQERTTYTELKDRAEINQIRSLYDIPVLTDEESEDLTSDDPLNIF